jgi:hypothetical protein
VLSISAWSTNSILEGFGLERIVFGDVTDDLELGRRPPAELFRPGSASLHCLSGLFEAPQGSLFHGTEPFLDSCKQSIRFREKPWRGTLFAARFWQLLEDFFDAHCALLRSVLGFLAL